MTTCPDVEFTDRDVAMYREQGFWIGPKIFDDPQVDAMRKEVIRTVRGERDFECEYFGSPPDFEPSNLGLTHIVNGWWVNAKLREVAGTPVIGWIASRLLRAPAVRLLHDQVLCKPGQGPDRSDPVANVGWHQDAAHWTRGRLNMPKSTPFCSAWIALQDTDLANGCMRFIAGSHKWGLVEDAHSFAEKDLDGLATRFAQGNREWVERPCLLKAGQVSFHSGRTFHGSGPNHTDAPRLSIVLNMMPAPTSYNAVEINLLAGRPWHSLQRPDRSNELFHPRVWPPD